MMSVDCFKSYWRQNDDNFLNYGPTESKIEDKKEYGVERGCLMIKKSFCKQFLCEMHTAYDT